jgi:hypothetical protein
MSSKFVEISKLINRYFVVKANCKNKNTVVISEHNTTPILTNNRLIIKKLFGENSKNDFNYYQKLGHNKYSY